MATINQETVFKKVTEKMRKGAKVSISAEMNPPYSKRFSEHPDKLKKSKGWEELMEKYLPDKLLAKKHKELLTIPKKVRTYIKGDLESEYEELDSQAISKGLDMGYKLKGKYQAEKIEHSGELNITSEDEKLAEDFIKFRKQNGGDKINT